MITIDDFAKLELKVGTVLEASDIEGSEKLLKLLVDLGPLPVLDDKKNDIRQILSGIKQWYTPADLKGQQFVFITNLEPRMMMGLESQGMILATDGEKPVPLVPQEQVPDGAKIR